MTTVTKGKLLRQDMELWDGVSKTANRKDSTGGTISGLVVGYEVDVLASYGNGENYTWQTIDDCIRRIGSASCTLIFNPGTWTIDQDLTIGSNFTCRVPAGAVFSVSSGKTLTFSGPVIRDSSTWTSGSGTVTENGTRTFTGLIDLTGAVLQGGTPLVFEGATANASETRFVITEPTADRTVTFPDADVDLSSIPSLSGNQTWTGNQINSGTVTMSGKSLWAAEGANVASTADCNIWTTDGNTVHVTGTTQIDDWGTAPQAGAWKRVIFDGALILNYNATTNDLPGDADITTAANDSCIVYARSASSYQIFDYTYAVGDLGSAKFVARLTTLGTTPTVTAIINKLGTITPSRIGVGNHRITWVNTLTDPVAVITSENTSGATIYTVLANTGLTGTLLETMSRDTATTLTDPESICITIWGKL